MSDISLTSNLNFSDGAQAGSIKTAQTLGYNFDTPKRFEDSTKALTTDYSAISFPSVGWTNLTLAAFLNRSTTPAEVMTLARDPVFVAGGTDDGLNAGASVPNTLTAAGYYRRISSAGVSQGKTWAIGDLAVYLGTSGAYLQLRPGPVVILKNGETAQLRMPGDGVAWYAKSALGTPDLGFVAVGALV